MASRSYEDLRPGQQLYNVIEYCQSPETLWSKIKSGHYDWLGVRERNGRQTFVLGRPPIGRTRFSASLTKSVQGADSRHRVEVWIPEANVPSVDELPTAEEATETFARTVKELQGDNVLADEEFVVRAIPNVL